MPRQLAWLRNSGVIAMVAAVTLWVGVPFHAYAWFTALCLWLFGCALISISGLAFLHQVMSRPVKEEPAPLKAKAAVA